MIDYRLEENRRDAFIEWMRWSIVNNDCDPSLFMANYLFDRYEHNQEQKLWVCWLYGTTYYLPTSWVIWNEFPDMELVGTERINDWNTANYSRLRYQTDTKYNKGHLATQFESYRKWVSTHDSQRAKLESLYGDNEVQTYQNLTNAFVKDLHKFGRYTTWFYLQTLKHCAGVPLEAKDLLLSDPGSKSHRNGLLWALGFERRIGEKLTPYAYEILEEKAAHILADVKEKLPPELRYKADFFAMETCLCSFKKLFRKSRGRYLGYYLDRQAEEIKKVETDGWDGIYWQPWWDARNETIEDKSLLGGVIEEHRMHQFLDLGSIERVKYTNNLEAFFA